ncbi:hypothetical protein ACFL50_05050 [Candidatus Latescibacterota bacterium]
MLKLTRIALIVFILAAGLSSQAVCQGKNVGIGIMLGEPTGFSAKVWQGADVAIDGGIAWSLAEDTRINIHADMLWHNWNVLEDAFEIEDTVRLPLYYGVGGRLKAEDDTRIGMRFVFGSSLIFEDAPFDIFFELVPIMDIIPKTELDINVAFGGRFWF